METDCRGCDVITHGWARREGCVELYRPCRFCMPCCAYLGGSLQIDRCITSVVTTVLKLGLGITAFHLTGKRRSDETFMLDGTSSNSRHLEQSSWRYKGERDVCPCLVVSVHWISGDPEQLESIPYVLMTSGEGIGRRSCMP